MRMFRFILLLFLPALSAFAQNNQNQDAFWNYRYGRDMESRNRLPEAQYFYGEAVRISNEEISKNAATRDTYVALTWSLQRQRKYADVITWGERGLRLFSDEYRIVEIMGEAYFYLEDYDESLRFMQRYANSEPRGERAGVAYFFIGEIFRLRKQFHHADVAYTMAVMLESSIALWWFRLGSVREANEDFPQAVQAYERAIRINSNYRDALDGLARSRR